MVQPQLDDPLCASDNARASNDTIPDQDRYLVKIGFKNAENIGHDLFSPDILPLLLPKDGFCPLGRSVFVLSGGA